MVFAPEECSLEFIVTEADWKNELFRMPDVERGVGQFPIGVPTHKFFFLPSDLDFMAAV